MTSPHSTPAARPLGVGLYGFNGHQIHSHLVDNPRAELVAVAGAEPSSIPAEAQGADALYRDLDQLLADPRVQLVSLCSPRRAEQAQHAIRALEAGKHVYAEKPCGLSEAEIDAIVAATHRSGCRFHEMAGTTFQQPYRAMAEVVLGGQIGEVVQVFAQKSYPWFDARPQDEGIDGGLLVQAGVHAARMIEQVAGQPVTDVTALQTRLGNPVPTGDLHMAASVCLRLAGGAVASMIVNYLNPAGTGMWGNETLCVFGTRGLVESTAGGANTRLIVGDQVLPLPINGPSLDYFELFLDELLDGKPMPFTLEQELHPTRVVIRARAAAARAADG